jgi:formate dehydrogenase assembly factor FdhD
MTGILKKVKEDKMPMCKAVEEWIEEERDIGRKEGINKILGRMLAAGMDEAAILNITQCSKEELAAAAQQ